MASLPTDVEVLVTDWFRRVRESQSVHYACANHFSRLHFALGLPTIFFTTVVGTAVFASMQKQVTGTWSIVVGLMSIAAAVLASLQTFLRLSERADKHRVAGAAYGAVRRALELLKTFPPEDQQALRRE